MPKSGEGNPVAQHAGRRHVFDSKNVSLGNGMSLMFGGGYNTRRLTGVNVLAGANSLGDIRFIAGGPYQLVPIAPDVNRTFPGGGQTGPLTGISCAELSGSPRAG